MQIPADLIAKINEATLASQKEQVIEKVDIPINNNKVDGMMEDRRKAISSDIAENREVPLLQGKSTVVTTSTGTTTSTTPASTTMPQRTAVPYQQPSTTTTLDDRIKSSITQRMNEIEEASRKEVASELKALSATPAKKKSLYEESTLKTDLKIIGLKAGCGLLEKIVRDGVFTIAKNIIL